MATWETVCELLEELPGTEQDPAGGMPVGRVGRKLVAYIPGNSAASPHTLERRSLGGPDGLP